ncbi:MAG: hypothetical protein AB1665_03380 [Candidatus Thermoplasmatota archaeon]
MNPIPSMGNLMAAKKARSKSDDWFDALEVELDERTQKLERDLSEQSIHKQELNKTLISDFWKVLLRFEKIGIHFSMEPSHEMFARFEKFPYEWTLKEGFDFANVSSVTITDRTRDQGRVSDSLRIRYYIEEGVQHLRLLFEYCEGEHYYKYSGWKRIFVQYILYDAPVDKVEIDAIHDILAGVVKTWYESHLKRNRNLLLSYMKDTFERGESFAQ